MIEITFNPKNLELKIDGHAGADEKGKDIVCAAVSVLFYTLGNCLSDSAHMIEGDITFTDEDGHGHIQCKPKEMYVPTIQRTYYTVLTGLYMLAEAYPQYILLK